MVEGGIDQLGPVEEVVRDQPGRGADPAGQGSKAQTGQAALGDEPVRRRGKLGPAIERFGWRGGGGDVRTLVRHNTCCHVRVGRLGSAA